MKNTPTRNAGTIPTSIRSMVLAFSAGAALLTAAVTLSPAVASAQSCNGTTDVFGRCQEEFRSGLRNTFRYGGYNNYDAARRAGSVGEALRNCHTCVHDHLKDRINSFGSSNYGYSSGNARR